MNGVEPKRDKHGRLLGPDGYPVAGLATVKDAVEVSSLSKSMVYHMIDTGELESKRYGRSVRIPWASIREEFLAPDCA